jgi:phosphinothricin acetyltransferase
MVGLERVERLRERAGHLRDAAVFLEEVVVARVARVEAALAPVSGRCCYRGVAEDSVYVASRAHGRGVGRALLERLVEQSEAAGIWTLQAGIFPENTASVRLHLGCGFRLLGVHERLGELDGVWRDVLRLERRSESVG